MTDAEIRMLSYEGNRRAAERAGLPVTGAGADSVMEYSNVERQKGELKKPGALVVHDNTSREGELFMLEEAAIRIQRAYRMRKMARAEEERKRSAITRDDPDAIIDADMFDAAYKGDYRTLKSLIARGASVNSMGAYGQYPIHYAIAGGNKKCVSLLLEHLASVNVQDAKGDTPLHVAARTGDIEIIRALVKRRADRSACNYAGKTPRAIARRYGEKLCMEELTYVVMDEEDVKARPDLIAQMGMQESLFDEKNEVEMTKISVEELEMLRRDLDQWRDTAKRCRARERLAAKRAHNWEQQYHMEIDPLKHEVKRMEAEIELYKKDILENIELHKGAKDAINEAELAKHAMFLKKRQAEFDLSAVKQQMADAERGIEYTRERMTNDLETMELERNRYRDELRQTESQMEEYIAEVKKLEAKIAVKEKHDKENQTMALETKQKYDALEKRFQQVKDARQVLSNRVKTLMDQVSELKTTNARLKDEQAMMQDMGMNLPAMAGGARGMGMAAGGFMPNMMAANRGMMGFGGSGFGMGQSYMSPQPPRGGMGRSGRRHRHRSDY